MTINLKAQNGTKYPIDIKQNNVLRITPNTTGFDVDIGSNVGKSGESWKRTYTNIPLKRNESYNYFTFETPQRMYFNELKIKRVK